MSKNSFYQVHRKQFPLSPAEALTIHKSQGSTYESVCVNVEKPLSRELLYAALSRVTSLSKLFIIGDFKAPKPPNKDNETMIEIERLKNEREMKLSFWPLTSKLGTVIGYHNVVSSKKYKNHIVNDEWYNRCDIIIFVETQTMPSFEPTLLDFHLVHRSNKNSSIGTRGILIFAKPHVKISLVHESLKYSKLQPSKAYHSEIFVFELPETNLITGYKSPSTPARIFQDQIDAAFNEIDSNGCKQNILMGDFNFDISQKGSSLKSMLAKFNLTSKFDEPTTKHNTQIDVIFADFPNIVAGAYECYFSDHKPICCMLHNKNVTQESLQSFNQLSFDSSKLKRKSQIEHHEPQPLAKMSKINYNNTHNVIIVPSDIQVSPVNAEIAAETSRREQIKRICHSIRKQRKHMDDHHITAFITVANNSGLCAQNMADTLFAQNISHYEYYSTINTDGVQIIYQGNSGIENVGHFVCIHYVLNEKTVYIYDALYEGCGYVDDPYHPQNQINERTRRIIQILYPHHIQRVVVKARTTQLDLISCGV